MSPVRATWRKDPDTGLYRRAWYDGRPGYIEPGACEPCCGGDPKEPPPECCDLPIDDPDWCGFLPECQGEPPDPGNCCDFCNEAYSGPTCHCESLTVFARVEYQYRPPCANPDGECNTSGVFVTQVLSAQRTVNRGSQCHFGGSQNFGGQYPYNMSGCRPGQQTQANLGFSLGVRRSSTSTSFQTPCSVIASLNISVNGTGIGTTEVNVGCSGGNLTHPIVTAVATEGPCANEGITFGIMTVQEWRVQTNCVECSQGLVAPRSGAATLAPESPLEEPQL